MFIEQNNTIIFEYPDGEKIQVFGESHIDEIAAELNIPVLGKVPVKREFAGAADEGRFAEVINHYVDDAAAALRK